MPHAHTKKIDQVRGGAGSHPRYCLPEYGDLAALERACGEGDRVDFDWRRFVLSSREEDEKRLEPHGHDRTDAPEFVEAFCPSALPFFNEAKRQIWPLIVIGFGSQRVPWTEGCGPSTCRGTGSGNGSLVEPRVLQAWSDGPHLKRVQEDQSSTIS